MSQLPVEADESERIEALRGYGILDTEREPAFDAIADLAADICEAPIAVVNFVADTRQWFKAELGIGRREAPLDLSICRHAIGAGGVMVVPDLAADARFADNPLVTAEGGLRFYAGAPILTPEGLALGTVCVLDRAPRPGGLAERQGRVLVALARQVTGELELRQAVAERDRELAAGWQREAEREATRAETEGRLRRREEELAQALRIGRIGGFDIDLRDGLRSHRSPEYLALHGLPPETVEDGHDGWVARLHPEDRDAAERHFLDVVASGARDYRGEYRIVRPSDGAVRWIAAFAEIEHDGDGPARLVGVHADITDRREAEERRRESEAGYRALFEQAAVGVARMSPDGRFRDVNDRFCEIAGRPREALLTTDWQSITHPDDIEADGAQAREVTEGRRPSYRMDKRYVRADGGVVWVNLTVSALRDPGGRVTQVMAVVEDISERKRTEESRQILLKELNHRVKNLFAVTEGLVRLTSRTARSPADMAAALSGRLAALARAHDLLRFAVAGDGAGEAVALRSVAAAVLAPHLAEGSPRLRMEGPPVILGPEAATALALVLHELATNAAKYGCLRTLDGWLELGWRVGERALSLLWREAGGPAASAPSTTGFGSRLTEMTVEGQLGGRIDRLWAPEGLRVAIELPLTRLAR